MEEGKGQTGTQSYSKSIVSHDEEGHGVYSGCGRFEITMLLLVDAMFGNGMSNEATSNPVVAPKLSGDTLLVFLS